MTPAQDPSEQIGTPEYDEIRQMARNIAEGILDLIEEQANDDLKQFPSRFSH